MLDYQDYNKILSSRHRLFDLHLHEAYEYRNLAFLFVKRDFVSTYKQTIFGPVWFLLNPLLTTIVFTIIFGDLAGLPTFDATGDKTVPGFLFYMASNICWGYFSGTVLSTSNTFRANAGLMSKVYYPRIISPIASAISNLINFGVQFLLFLVLLIIFASMGNADVTLSWYILLIPFIILEMAVFAIGCGIIISSATTKYRDLGMLVGVLLRFWQYATPILYGLTLITQQIPQLTWLYMLNPVTPMITTFRYAVFGFGYFNLLYYSISWGVSLLVFITGLIVFSRVERSFVDTI